MEVIAVKNRRHSSQEPQSPTLIHPAASSARHKAPLAAALSGAAICLSCIVVLRSGEVEAIEVHHLVPGRDEIVDELLLGVGTSVDLRQCAELGVRTKEEVDARAGPLQFARLPITAFEDVGVWRNRLPSGVRIEQGHEEVVG